MPTCDSYAVTHMDWRRVHATIADVLQEKGATRRGVRGVDPSTVVRWCKPLDEPVDMTLVLTALEQFGVTPTEFFLRVEGQSVQPRRSDSDSLSVNDQRAAVTEHPAVPESDRLKALSADLVELCLRAGNNDIRINAVSVFDELAYGFAVAVDPSVEGKDAARAAVNDAREQRREQQSVRKASG